MTPRDATEALAQVFSVAPAAGQGSVPLLRALLDAVPVRVVMIDRDSRYLYANRRFLDFVGLDEAEVLGRTPGELLGEGIGQIYTDIMPRMLSTGESFRWSGWADYGRHGRRYVEGTLVPYAPEGSMKGMLSFWLDLTDFKHQEDELAARARAQHESDRFHAAVVSSALDSIIVADEVGRIVEFNPAAEQTFGFPRAAVLGRAVVDVVVPPGLRRPQARALLAQMTGQDGVLPGQRVEQMAMRSDGSVFPVELAVSEVNIDGRKLYTAHIRDLTAAHEARAEIERQQQALLQKEKLATLGSMLSSIAHEINNPLSIVVGQATLLNEAADDGMPPPGMKDRLRKVLQAAERSARIVRGMLNASRQTRTEPRRFTLSALLGDVLEPLSGAIAASGIRLDIALEQDLPPLCATPDHLHQILTNLVVNAQQSIGAAGTPNGHLRIAARKDGDTAVRIVVEDNGPGIQRHDRGRLFEPFFTTKPRGIGTGLGLSVSRGLAEINGGSLAFEDAAPGARFLLRLPMATAETTSAEAAHAAIGPAQRGSALVIEPESEMALLLSELLCYLGFDSVAAPDEATARKAIDTTPKPFDLILCDLGLPKGGGAGFLGWLAAEHPELAQKLAFTSGDVLGPALADFIAGTGKPLLEKPFTLSDLQALAERLTGRVATVNGRNCED